MCTNKRVLQTNGNGPTNCYWYWYSWQNVKEINDTELPAWRSGHLNLDKNRKNFKTLTSEDCPEFPKLTEQDLVDITLGSYQIKMAKLYVSAHLDNEGKYSFQICTDKDKPGLLRVQVHSRHKNNTLYKVYVKYQPNGRGSDSIIGYVCRCKVGSRTVGCCSHIASVLWFLGYGRYKGPTKRPGHHNIKIFAPSDVEDSD